MQLITFEYWSHALTDISPTNLKQSLEDLPPLIQPEAINTYPAYGWYSLAIIIVAVLTLLTLQLVRHIQIVKQFRPTRSYLKQMLSELMVQTDEQDFSVRRHAMLMELSKLIKKVCVEHDPSSNITLTGKNWLVEADQAATSDKEALLTEHVDSFNKLYNGEEVTIKELQSLIPSTISWLECLEKNALNQSRLARNSRPVKT